MKKFIVLIVVLVFSLTFLISGCSPRPTTAGESSGLSSQAASASISESDSTDTSDIVSSEDTSSGLSEPGTSDISSGSQAVSQPSSLQASSGSQPVSSSLSTSSASTAVESNIIARFKLVGGSGDVVLKDMDGLGYIGTCPLKYVNAQNGETIRNAEWKTDSKFAKYFNALHTATKILFDASEDAKEGEQSTRLRADPPFTVSAWIRPSTYTPAGSPDFRVIAAYGANGPIDHWDLKLLSNNELSFYHSAVATEDQPYDSGYILEDNKWYHVSITFTTTKLTYYVNGKVVATKNFNGDMEFLTTRGNFAIGGLVEGAYSFRGGIAEVCVFKGIVLPKDTTKYPIG